MVQVRPIKSARIDHPRPSKGEVPPTVTAEYIVAFTIAEMIGTANVIRALRPKAREIKKIISRSVARAYKASGLGIISGDLHANATQNFNVTIRLRGERGIRIEAVWNDPDIDYFFIHLYGSRDGNYAGRPFIKFDEKAGQSILKIIINAIKDLAAGKKPIERRAREEEITVEARLQNVERARVRPMRDKGRIPAKGLVPPGKRPTPYRIRKSLRDAGVEARKAREMQRRLAGIGLSPTAAGEIAGLGEKQLAELSRIILSGIGV